MAAAFVITGDKKLNAKLARLTSKEAKAVIRKAARPALKPVLSEAKLLVPRDSGLLRRSLTVRALRRSRRQVGARVTTREGLFAGETFYGGFQEWGWKTRRGKIEGRHFLLNAAKRKEEMAISIYRRLIRAGILQLAKR